MWDEESAAVNLLAQGSSLWTHISSHGCCERVSALVTGSPKVLVPSNLSFGLRLGFCVLFSDKDIGEVMGNRAVQLLNNMKTYAIFLQGEEKNCKNTQSSFSE